MSCLNPDCTPQGCGCGQSCCTGFQGDPNAGPGLLPAPYLPPNPYESYGPPCSADANRSTYPVNAKAAQGAHRVEPILTAPQLITRFLKGIPLVSAVMNPMTKKHDVWTVEDLKDNITRACSMVELMTNIVLTPVEFAESFPFDRNLLDSYMHFKTNQKPILKVNSIAIRPGVGTDIYRVPPEWVSNAYFNNGQINLVPLVSGYSTQFLQTATGGGAVFLQILSGASWIPSFWQVNYTSGFPDGQVPIVVNELIGVTAAIEVLGGLGATNRVTSTSLGIDAMSQSVGTPGPNVYAKRIEGLEAQQKALVSKFKALYGTKFAMGTM